MCVAVQQGMRPVLLSRLPESMVCTLTGRLERGGRSTVVAVSEEALLDAVLDTDPCALVHALRPDPAPDLALLRLVRRAAPALPLILLAERGSLDVQRAIVELRPAFYDVLPVDPCDVAAALEAVSCRDAKSRVKRAGARRRA